MPYKEKNAWRAKVAWQGRRYTAHCPTRQAALDWESAKRKELKLSRSSTHTGFLLTIETEYLRMCEMSFHPVTFTNKRKALQDLNVVVGNIPVDQVRPSDILHKVILAQKTPNLANERRKHLYAFFEYCRKFSGLQHNPMAYIAKLPIERKPQTVPTREEFLKLLMAASRHDRNLLIACATTGGRRSEILQWTWEDIDFNGRTVRLGTRKNRKRELRYRTVEMNEDLFIALQDQLATRLPQSDYVFQNRALWKSKDGRILHYHPNYGDRFTARRAFMAGLCKRAKIKKRIGFHALRRFFASILAENMETLPTIQKLLGHSAASTTDRYIYRLKDDARAAVNRIELMTEKAREGGTQQGGN